MWPGLHGLYTTSYTNTTNNTNSELLWKADEFKGDEGELVSRTTAVVAGDGVDV